MCFIKRGVQQTPSTTNMCLYLGHSNRFRFCKMSMAGCDLSDKVLTHKLVILMALSSTSRASAIHHLDVRYMLRTEGKFIFTLHKLHKSWKYGKVSQSLEFCEYTEDRDHCVVTTLNEYIEHTYQWCTEKKMLSVTVEFYSAICGSVLFSCLKMD